MCMQVEVVKMLWVNIRKNKLSLITVCKCVSSWDFGSQMFDGVSTCVGVCEKCERGFTQKESLLHSYMYLGELQSTLIWGEEGTTAGIRGADGSIHARERSMHQSSGLLFIYFVLFYAYKSRTTNSPSYEYKKMVYLLYFILFYFISY